MDNVYSIGVRAGDSGQVLRAFLQGAAAKDLAVHVECEEAELAEVLGLELDGRGGRRRLRPRA